ncbi:MAG: hypothetical protein QF613_03900 [Candidatus Marinimicrobia bacterium]|nr:hypothetical protein [Candidatus Neomarinimicrobiota bacterium]
MNSIKASRIFAPVVTIKKEKTDIHLFEEWTYTVKNYLLFGIGLLTIIAGYVIMAKGKVDSFQSLTLAPIMLFFGYVIIIPAALIYRDKSKQKQ